MRAQGSFVRLSENAIISNMVTEPRYFFVDQEHSCTVVLPKATFGFRMLWDSFTFGQVNVVPHWEAMRPSGGRVLMGGLTYARTGKGGSQAGGQKGQAGQVARALDGAPARLVFPGRIFSHCLLKLDKCASQCMVGFVVGPQGQEQVIRLNFRDAEVETSAKVKLEGDVVEQRMLRSGDELCLHYFYRGKKLKCYLLVKLIRNETALDIGYLEVPEGPSQLVIWLGDDGDSISVVRARLNAVQRRDQTLDE